MKRYRASHFQIQVSIAPVDTILNLYYIENHIPIFHCSNDLDVAIYTDEQKVSHKSVIIAFGTIMSNGTEKTLSSLRSLGTRTFTLPKIVKLNGTVSGVELFRKPCFQI